VIQEVHRAKNMNRAWFPEMGSSRCQNNIFMMARWKHKLINISKVTKKANEEIDDNSRFREHGTNADSGLLLGPVMLG